MFEIDVSDPEIHFFFFFSEIDGAQGALSDRSSSSDVGLQHVEGHVSAGDQNKREEEREGLSERCFLLYIKECVIMLRKGIWQRVCHKVSKGNREQDMYVCLSVCLSVIRLSGCRRI